MEAYLGLRIPAGDQNWFLPVSWVYAHTGNLSHPYLTPLPDKTDLSFTWHGWLMPLLLGQLPTSLNYEKIIAPLYFASILFALFYAAFSMKEFKTWTAIALSALFFSTLSYQIGRPELFVSIILSIYLLMRGKINSIFTPCFYLHFYFCCESTCSIGLRLYHSDARNNNLRKYL